MRPLSTEVSAPTGGPITPASDRFDPFEAAFLNDPYPLLAQLQAGEPVFFSPSLRSWVVTRHETVRAVLRDNRRFSARIVSDPLTPLCPHARAIITDAGVHVPPLLANHDPASFPEPDAFVPGRRNAMQHLAFGAGPHFCLGAPLARLELEIMLQRAAARIPTLALVDSQAFAYTPNTSVRALRRLMVSW